MLAPAAPKRQPSRSELAAISVCRFERSNWRRRKGNPYTRRNMEHVSSLNSQLSTSIRPDKGFDNSALRTLGFSNGTNRVAPDRGRDNKSFGVVDHKRIKCAAQAFDYRLSSFDQ